MATMNLKYEQEYRLKTAKMALGLWAGEFLLSKLLFGSIFTLFSGVFIYAFAIYALIVNLKVYKRSKLVEGADELMLKIPQRGMILSGLAIGLQVVMNIFAIYTIYLMMNAYQTLKF